MTAGEITVREAAPDDIGTLVAFQQATARETEGKDLDSQVATKGVSAVFQPPDRGFYLVAETGGQVVGGLLITYGWSDWRNATFWWIQSLYVEPQWRRNGAVYRALHDHVHSLATSHQGVSGLRLQVERRHCVAQQTYANLGMARSQYDLLEMDFLP